MGEQYSESSCRSLGMVRDSSFSKEGFDLTNKGRLWRVQVKASCVEFCDNARYTKTVACLCFPSWFLRIKVVPCGRILPNKRHPRRKVLHLVWYDSFAYYTPINVMAGGFADLLDAEAQFKFCGGTIIALDENGRPGKRRADLPWAQYLPPIIHFQPYKLSNVSATSIRRPAGGRSNLNLWHSNHVLMMRTDPASRTNHVL